MSQDNVQYGTITFQELIDVYIKKQKTVVDMVSQVAADEKSASPGKFLLLQFAMSQVTQIGDSISNLLSQVNSAISNSIKNQRTG